MNVSHALLTRHAVDVAPVLLGWVITRTSADGTVAVRLTEVEAYEGIDDPGSHAYRGRTDRNAVMFGPAGHLYVYFTYGMHVCANLVTGTEGAASAVLLRAGEVVEGIELAQSRRAAWATAAPARLASGPARLCTALGLGLADNGRTLADPDSSLTITPVDPPPDRALVRCGPRVGLRLAADRPWRFWLDGERSVSAYRPAKRL
jgi:DNA-3-methyladenine glycosylase